MTSPRRNKKKTVDGEAPQPPSEPAEGGVLADAGTSTNVAPSRWDGIGAPQRLEQIIENIPDMIFLKDAEELRFVALNRAGEELLGYDREELIGKSDFDFFPEAEANFFVEKDREVLQGGRLVDIPDEPIHTRFLGERILHTKKVPILSADGKPLYLLGISEDVTELRRTQAELQRAREELMASRLRDSQRMEQLGILAGGIAHDFNNFLVGIKGNVSLAEDLVEGDTELHRLLARIATAADGAAGLTQQMLAYSGGGQFVLECVDLGELIAEIGDLLAASMPKSAKLNLDVGHGLTVQADASQLRQLIMNLITNAADALGEAEGQIRVELNSQVLDGSLARRPWDVGELTAGRYVCLTVTDSGIGMDSDTLTRMFDPFFSTKDTGHGLGLSAIVGIVKAHEGVLHVSSEPGDGTRFLVAIPQVDGAPASRVVEQPARALPKALRAMIVDDEELVRQLAVDALSREGAVCTAADSGEAALELLRSEEGAYDLVLLDLSMPGMGGAACLQQIRQLAPRMPVLVSSGHDESNAPLLTDEVTGFLAKPYTVKALRAAVARTLAADPAS